MACKRSGVQFPSAPPFVFGGLNYHGSMPAVTVVMRTFERPVMLARAIASVQNQTFTDWELVVVNNGGDPAPVDSAVAVARQAQPSCSLRVIHLEDRFGMEEASNRALASCASEFFAIHDDDDSWREGFLGRAVEVARACARNNLLKCALHGEDPNWGRILAALGTTSAVFDPLTIDVSLNGVMVCKSSAPGEPRDRVNMKNETIEILIDLHAGTQSATIWTNDLTAAYVHENSAYSS